MTAIFVAVMLLLFFVDPATTKFSFKCPFKLLTGLDCPGCGGQRAVHDFLHGHFIEGLRYNPFLIIGLLYFACALIAQYIHRPWAEKLGRKILNIRVAITYIVLLFAWWILRNII